MLGAKPGRELQRERDALRAALHAAEDDQQQGLAEGPEPRRLVRVDAHACIPTPLGSWLLTSPAELSGERGYREFSGDCPTEGVTYEVARGPCPTEVVS